MQKISSLAPTCHFLSPATEESSCPEALSQDGGELDSVGRMLKNSLKMVPRKSAGILPHHSLSASMTRPYPPTSSCCKLPSKAGAKNLLVEGEEPSPSGLPQPLLPVSFGCWA